MPRAEQGRGLRAVVFLDTVGSTEIASELGDERWQTLLRRELQILRRVLKEHGGREVDVAGDGLFALFDEPAAAVRYAASAVEAVREIGVEVRAGVHFGEVEISEGHPAGIVVHTGARAMSVGEAGQVIATQTLRDLVSGGHLRFADHGTHQLRGLPGTWSLYLLTEIDREQVAPPLGEEEASSRREQASEPVPLVKRRAFLVGAGASAVSLGAAALLSSLGEETALPRSPSPVVSGQRLFRYDAASETFTRLPTVFGSTGIDFLPCVAVGEGSVWTGDFYLHKVDPEDGSEKIIELGSGNSDFVGGVTTGFEDVWVVTARGIHRVGAGDGQPLDSRELETGGWQTAIVTGFDSIWVTTPSSSLFRLDPGKKGLPTIAEVPVGEVLSGVVVAGGLIWVSDEFGDVIPVDPIRNSALRPITVGGGPKGLAATERRLWAVDPQDQSVHVVDIEDRSLVRSIPIGGEPVDVATGLGFIWVADVEGRLIKIDEASFGFVEIPVEGPVAALAIDDEREALWLRTTHS